MSEQWEVLGCTQAYNLPEGWEPFAVTNDVIWVRRRVVRVIDRPLPRRVLSEKEMAARREEFNTRVARSKTP